MPTKDRNKHVDRAEQTTFGPGWYDVWIALHELRALCKEPIELRLSGGKAPNGKASLVFEVYRDGKFMFYCGKRFLDNGTESSKTAAAAAWVALRKAHYYIEEEQGIIDNAELEEKASEAKQQPLLPPERQE